MQTQMQTRIRIGSPTKRTQAHHAHQPGILKFELSEISDIVIIQIIHLYVKNDFFERGIVHLQVRMKLLIVVCIAV